MLQVRGPTGVEDTVRAVIDTGFNDELMLPLTLIQTLGLPFDMGTYAELADGRSVILDCYRGELLWDGQYVQPLILATDGDALIGMSLLYGHELRIQVIEGGEVTIGELP